jgi:hypothetical protein
MNTWRSGGIAPHFLTSALDGGEWVSFTPSPLYPQGKCPQYPLIRRLGGPQSQCRYCGEDRNLALLGIKPGSSNSNLDRNQTKYLANTNLRSGTSSQNVYFKYTQDDERCPTYCNVFAY